MIFLGYTIVYMLLGINTIKVDTNLNRITFVSLFSKQTIATEDINEYYETNLKAKFRTWNGLLIKTYDNKTIQVTAQNISSLSGFKNYLNERKIHCAGKGKMRFPFN